MDGKTITPVASADTGHPMDNPPAGTPSTEGMEQSDIASLLEKMNSGGGEAAQEATPKVETPEQPRQFGEDRGGQKDGLAVPDKFKNPDGSINSQNLLKSYLESEKNQSRMFQERSQWGKIQQENEALRQQIAEFQSWREQIEAQNNPETAGIQPDRPDGTYSPEQAQKLIDQRVEQKLKSFQKEQQEEAKVSRQINEAVNYGRANVDGFKQLEPEINQLISSPAFSRHPDAVEAAYFAVLGQKMPVILKQAKDLAYSAGYAKAKEELTRHVESGGIASSPVDTGNLSLDQIDQMKPEEVSRIVPRHNI